MSSSPRQRWNWVVVLVAVSAGVLGYCSAQVSHTRVAYSELKAEIAAGKIRAVVISGNEVTATRSSDDSTVRAYRVVDEQLMKLLEERDVKVTGSPETGGLATMLSWLFPIAMIAILQRHRSSPAPLALQA